MKSYNEEMSATHIEPTGYINEKAKTNTQRKRKSRLRAKLGRYAGTSMENLARDIALMRIKRDRMTDEIIKLEKEIVTNVTTQY